MENEDEEDLDFGMNQASSPGLSALAPDDTRAFLLEQAKRREEERSKLFQAELDRIEAAKQRLLAQPTQLSRQEMLRAIAGRLTQRPTDTSDPRFFERRNLFSTLRDVAEVGGQAAEAEKKAKLQQQAGIEELEALRGKYMYGAAEKAAEQARSDLARYREPTVPKLQADAQKIVDLQSIVDDESKPKQARDAAQRQIDTIGKSLSSEDRSTLGQMVQATRMANSSDPNQARIGKAFLARFEGKAPTLTVKEQREDLKIQNAINFLKTIPQAEIDKALRSYSQNRTPYQEKIIKSWELSQMPTFSSVLPTVGRQTATEDNLTEEEMAELEQLRKDFGK